MLVIDKYQFVFGWGFLKEINKKHTPKNNNGMNLGLERILPNLLNDDIETLVEVLLLANKTEDNKVNETELIELIAQHEDIDNLFEEVLEEMQESNFIKTKVTKIVNRVKEAQTILAGK